MRHGAGREGDDMMDGDARRGASGEGAAQGIEGLSQDGQEHGPRVPGGMDEPASQGRRKAARPEPEPSPMSSPLSRPIRPRPSAGGRARPLRRKAVAPVGALLDHIRSDEDRHGIWREANAEMRAVLAEAAGLLDRCERAGILGRWRLGELALRLEDPMERREARYGPDAAGRLKRFFPTGRGAIRRALELAEAFSQERIEELARVRLANGRRLTVTHMEALLAHAEEDRGRALADCVAESLSAEDLRARLRREEALRRGGAEDPETRGRPLAVPRTMAALLAQQDRSAGDFLSR
ncbi:MAG: hypothetical protein K2W96_06355, partial [Gemmataceae bacterium]|nr:hypothetical protein [Gemmataceae bacterium]